MMTGDKKGDPMFIFLIDAYNAAGEYALSGAFSLIGT